MGSSWYPSPQVEVFKVKLLGFLMFPWIQTCWVAACIFPGSLGEMGEIRINQHRLTARSARTMDVGLHAPYYPAVMMAVSCPIGGAWATQETWIDMDQDMDENMDQLPSTVCLNTHSVERGIYCSTVYLGTSASRSLFLSSSDEKPWVGPVLLDRLLTSECLHCCGGLPHCCGGLPLWWVCLSSVQLGMTMLLSKKCDLQANPIRLRCSWNSQWAGYFPVCLLKSSGIWPHAQHFGADSKHWCKPF